ncbi:MAG: alpha/beta hydrolase [Anaerolineales bacterium]|nr:alpha/beta hydrolase [Anaerolineales bacterium]
MSKFLKWMKRMLTGLLIFVLVLVALTWVAGSIAKNSLAAQYPAPGKLVDVGGYRMHIHCIGEGSPAVVMEAGLNDFSVQWSAVQAEIGQFARVCVYDRAGFGWSEASPHPRTVETMVSELHTLLQNAEVEAPYVMVGHSFGGIVVREFTHQYPNEVAGMLLVDSAHEQHFVRIPAFATLTEAMASQFKLFATLNSFGIMALSPAQIPARGLEGEALEQYRALLATTDYFNTAVIESSSFLAEFGNGPIQKLKSLGNLPLIVLTRGLPDSLPILSEQENAQYDATWHQLQFELVGLSSNSKQVMAQHSGHYIQLDEPNLVVDAVRELVDNKK